MWTRAELKNNAKLVLQRGYWNVLGTVLLAMMAAGAAGGAVGGIIGGVSSVGLVGIGAIAGPDNASIAYALFFILYMITLYLFIFLACLFVSLPITVGIYRYMMENREGHGSLSQIFWAFQGGRYLKTVKVLFHKYIRVFLWSLLFVVPGIIKAYEYWPVECMLAENADLEPAQYLEISSKTMNGEKANVFVLELSFIGWALLGTLACGVGVWFVYPYLYATYAELYALLRSKMQVTGIVGPEVLRGFAPQGGQNRPF